MRGRAARRDVLAHHGAANRQGDAQMSARSAVILRAIRLEDFELRDAQHDVDSLPAPDRPARR